MPRLPILEEYKARYLERAAYYTSKDYGKDSYYRKSSHASNPEAAAKGTKRAGVLGGFGGMFGSLEQGGRGAPSESVFSGRADSKGMRRGPTASFIMGTFGRRPTFSEEPSQQQQQQNGACLPV